MFRRTVINSGIEGWDGRKYEQTRLKLPALETSLLHEYADTVVSSMGVAFEDLRRQHQVESAGEIEIALMTLWAVTRELRRRCEVAGPRLDV